MQSLALFTTLVVALVTLLALSSSVVDACTTVLVGKKASADGSVMITHSNDGNSFTDARLVKVPGRIWREGSSKGNMRPVYQTIGDFPRYVGTEKGTHHEMYTLNTDRRIPRPCCLAHTFPSIVLPTIHCVRRTERY